jgi:hypothetical protein
MSLRDKICNAQDIEKELVAVPQWDATIEVRSMSAKARARLLKFAVQADGKMDFEKLYPAILIACCYDPESGDPVFTDGDEAMLNSKSAGPVETIAQVGMRMSGLAQGALDEGKDASS